MYADRCAFEIETTDAVKVYYAAMLQRFDEKPDAQTLKNEAASSDSWKGKANVTAGQAAFTVTELMDGENFVLYVAAEARDGTLSKNSSALKTVTNHPPHIAEIRKCPKPALWSLSWMVWVKVLTTCM